MLLTSRARLLRIVLLPVVLLLIAPSTGQRAAAQDVAMEGTLPDSIVVTASRLAEAARQTGRRITVWTARDLAALPVTSYDELLRTVGGLEVQSRGGFGVQSDLTMRGSTFNGVLVLVDGARLNDPMTGHFLADLPVPLSEIARIEVLRGPATALYGPDALGGVVQLFTYAGLREARQARADVAAHAAAQRGDFDLYDLDAAVRYDGRRTTFSAATAWQGSDGMPIANAEGLPVQSADGAVRTDFERQAHSVALARVLDRVTLFTRVGVDDRDFGAFHFYTDFPSDTAREATSTYWAQVRLQNQPAAATRWSAQVAARQHEDTYVYNPVTPANEHTSRLLTGQAQLSRALRPRLLLTTGASASLRGIESNNLGTHQDASAGAFLAARWQPLARLTLNASGRLDVDPSYGLEATPQLSAAYNQAWLTLRAGVSRAVRAPNYVERYINTAVARPQSGNLGNPDLEPEQAWAYEAGFDVYPLAGLSLHATAFTRTTRNLIDYVRLEEGGDPLFVARNLLEVRTRGVEVDVEGKRTLGASRLRLAATYTGLDADLGGLDRVSDYKYALTNARHLVQGAGSLTLHGATLGLQALWKDRLQGDSYGLVHARLAYQLYVGAQRLIFSGEVRNLFDTEYTEVFDAPMPGRWWLAGARLVF